MTFCNYIMNIKMFILGIFIVIPLACTSQSQAPTGSKKSADDEDTEDEYVEDDECSVTTSGSSDYEDEDNDNEDDDNEEDEDNEDDDNEDDDEFELKNSRSYSLKAFTFKADFEKDFNDNCVSCHKKGNEPEDGDEDYDCSDPGDAEAPVAIDLSNVELIKENFDEILERMEADDDCKMPPTGKLDIDVGDFEEWGDDGFELGESEEEEETTDATGCGSAPSPVVDEEEEDQPDSAFFKEFLNPSQLEECKSKGKLLRRSNLKCIEGYDLAAKCDDSWIQENTSWTAADLKAEVEKRESASNTILDQCGFNDKDAYILYYCPALESGGKCVSLKEVEESDSANLVIREFSVQLNIKKD